MSDTRDKLRIAALADLHVKARSDELRDLLRDVSQAADVLVLAGDLTDTGKPTEAEILAEELRACSVPMVGVLGNHDYEQGQADEVKAILADSGLRVLDGQSCEVDGVSFVGAKGFAGGFGSRMLSSFGEPAIKAFVSEAVQQALLLENAMRTTKAGRAMVILHYAPVADTVEGEPPEIYPFLGSSRLGETIDRFEVDAIVHGHAHHGRYEGRTRRGAPVYNVAWGIKKPSGRPYALLEL